MLLSKIQTLKLRTYQGLFRTTYNVLNEALTIAQNQQRLLAEMDSVYGLIDKLQQLSNFIAYVEATYKSSAIEKLKSIKAVRIPIWLAELIIKTVAAFLMFYRILAYIQPNIAKQKQFTSYSNLQLMLQKLFLSSKIPNVAYINRFISQLFLVLFLLINSWFKASTYVLASILYIYQLQA